MTEPRPALHHLADAHGIALEYHDIWGKLHRIDAAALRALLAAMHVPAGDDDSVATELHRVAAATRATRLAPMSVLRSQRGPWHLPVHIPAAAAAARLVWRLVGETGEVRHHPIDPARVRARDAVEHEGETIAALDVELAFDLPMGYYRVSLLADDDVVAEGDLAVAPPACYRPPALSGGRVWGAAVQLYTLASPRNWGIGDFGDLGDFATRWGAAGADVLGINPLHALFPHDPERASPYGPSSRLFLNTLYLDVAALPEVRWSTKARVLVASAAFRERLEVLRSAPLVRYADVADVKQRVLSMAYTEARRATHGPAKARRAAFEAFRTAGGEALQRHARFEALQEHFHAADPGVWGWPVWPVAYRDPESDAVQRFAEANAERVDFFAWLQWQATLQRAEVAARAREAGMRIGLHTDLAVSVDRSGSETWSHQSLYAVDASVGAPPDGFNVNGQDWGLPPMIPARLAACGFAPFIATLRATMRDAGALRIDHVMALFRLFWVPPGAGPARGTYVRYPSEDLLGLLALESHRNQCAVIGEDLGTVPDEVRAALAANDILSYRVLLFERDGTGDFRPASAYPEPALAAGSTHDLPTLAGWWEGHDIELRARHGMLGEHPDVGRELRQRGDERSRLCSLLAQERLLGSIEAHEAAQVPLAPATALALQRFLARTPCVLMVVQPEDVLGMREPVNLPGTSSEHPNWRRRLTASVTEIAGDARFVELAAMLRTERPRPPVERPASHPPSPGRAARPRPAIVPLPLAAIPRATYRLQLHRDFTFRDAAALVPYLAALGVSHLYLSPYLKARPGSRHGYDVVDHAALNPEIGTRRDFDALADALAAHGMGHICDVVPNHMAILGEDNAWWMDVLQHGPASAYATYFDIDWHPPDASLDRKVLVPVLGEPYGTVLEQGGLRLAFEADTGTFAVRYFEHRLPIDPRTYPAVLDRIDVHPDAPGDLAALRALAEAWHGLPTRYDDDPARRGERRERAAALSAALARLVATSPALRNAIEQAVERVNGKPGEPASFDALDALLDAQAWRAAFWRVASDEINYRRFFDINELAGLRTERDEVFEATHGFLLGLAAEGRIAGLRIDHPDGLRDPSRYFERLQARYRDAVAARGKEELRGDGIYLVVEKICAPHESLPPQWHVHGETGYVFANTVNGVLVDPTALQRIDRVWRAFVGAEAEDFERIVHDCKRAILAGPLAAALTTLTGKALAIARGDRHTRDFTYSILRHALGESAACFPVYRTYVSERGADPADRRYVDWAVARARRSSGIADPTVFDFVRSLLLADVPDGASADASERRLDFALAFQQFTAPVAAKGVEDTAFYRHVRLVSLNEVGGDPVVFGLTRRAFHRAMRDRAQRWPHALSATSTHDNKRSEDVRARIDVISERAGAWRAAVRRWSKLNRSRRVALDDGFAPSRSDEYLLYQTLVGTFPVEDNASLDDYRGRIEAYMLKAAREAKLRTSWTGVDEAYESALASFVGALLAPRDDHPFLDDLRREAREYAWYGWLNSLSMTLLKLAAPGVPDIYQGTELPDLSLVDPDNRRAVDYRRRSDMLGQLRALATQPAEARAEGVRALLGRRAEAKLWLVRCALALRAAHPALVAFGNYVPLTARGTRARHVLAFARRHGDDVLIVVAARLFASMGLATETLPLGTPVWGDDVLEVGLLEDGTVLVDALTGASLLVADGGLPLAALLASFPGALLVAGREGQGQSR